MKKRTRILSVLLTAVMLTGLLAGCGGAESGKETSAAQTGESVAAPEGEETVADQSGDVFEVEFWFGDPSKDAVMTELIEKYNETTGKENGIQINATLSTALNDMLKLGVENGELPLIVHGDRFMADIDGGAVIPFSKLSWGQEFVDNWTAKTGDYGVASRRRGSEEIYDLVYAKTGPALYYNKDMFKEAGIVDENGEAKPPATWSEFLKDCEILSNGTTYGLALPMQWNSCGEYTVLYSTFGAMKEFPLDIDWDTLTATFNASDQFDIIAQIYQKGYCVPGAETIDNDPARSYFSEGVAGMFFGYSWDIGVFTSQFVPDFEWDVCWLGAEDGTDYGTKAGVSYWASPTIAALELSDEEQENSGAYLNGCMETK